VSSLSTARLESPDLIFNRSSINEVICHGIPDQRKLQEGDIINIGTSDYSHGSSVLHIPRKT
jgi:methionine aminopeptidase